MYVIFAGYSVGTLAPLLGCCTLQLLIIVSAKTGTDISNTDGDKRLLRCRPKDTDSTKGHAWHNFSTKLNILLCPPRLNPLVPFNKIKYTSCFPGQLLSGLCFTINDPETILKQKGATSCDHHGEVRSNLCQKRAQDQRLGENRHGKWCCASTGWPASDPAVSQSLHNNCTKAYGINNHPKPHQKRLYIILSEQQARQAGPWPGAERPQGGCTSL